MEELDLSQMISLFWHRRVQIILIVLIFAVIGVTYTMCFITPKYTASTTLVLAAGKDSTLPTSITATDVTLNSKLISTYREIATSDKVVRKVINNLGLDISEQSLKNGITVKVVSDSEVIKISVTMKNQKLLQKLQMNLQQYFLSR